MKTVYLLVLVGMLLLIVALGTYEAFAALSLSAEPTGLVLLSSPASRGKTAASAGGALIQLSTSHVPTPDDIHNARVYGMNNQVDDDEQKDMYNGNIDGIFKLDNSPYGPF